MQTQESSNTAISSEATPVKLVLFYGALLFVLTQSFLWLTACLWNFLAN